MKIKIIYKEANKDNNISFYLFGIRIKKIQIGKKNNKQKDKKLNKKSDFWKQIIKLFNNRYNTTYRIIKTFKVKKLDMDLGINLDDPIYNAYAISFINSIIPLILASKNTDINKIRYTTFISDKAIFLNIDCIISISLIRNITSIIKVISVAIKIKLRALKKNINKGKKKLIEKMA